MSAGGGMPPVDLDLRIKAGAAFTCDLVTRAAGRSAVVGAEGRGDNRFAESAVMPGIERRWLRRLAYLAFAVALAIPWILLLADQLPR